MAAVLDDLDARPGSATSLLRTVIGSAVRAHGGWITSASLVAMMEALGVPADRTRTALTRVKAKGLLIPEARGRAAGYRVSADALAMLARGDRRIYHPRTMADGDRWCLISFTVPETQRHVRHQLRRRLAWVGCGTVVPALWICPEHLTDEVQGMVAELGLGDQVTIFLSDEVRGAADLAGAVARWWDLSAIRALHERFLAGHDGALRAVVSDPSPRTAFRVWTAALDAWRPIPYLDPGLPTELLPRDWPGALSIPLFLELRDRVQPRAAAFVDAVVGTGPAPVR